MNSSLTFDTCTFDGNQAPNAPKVAKKGAIPVTLLGNCVGIVANDIIADPR